MKNSLKNLVAFVKGVSPYDNDGLQQLAQEAANYLLTEEEFFNKLSAADQETLAWARAGWF